eukprot:12913304-Prorocentrum_lima.AAC.1
MAAEWEAADQGVSGATETGSCPAREWVTGSPGNRGAPHSPCHMSHHLSHHQKLPDKTMWQVWKMG